MSGKRCCTCGEVKAVGAFSRNRRMKDGLDDRCKACKRHYREEHREARAEYNRRYREENREAIAEYHRRYDEENREARREYNRRYREEHREVINENKRRHAQAMRDATREVATRNGERYTPAEDAHILASDEPLVVIAVDLGRTLKSVACHRSRLRKAVSA